MKFSHTIRDDGVAVRLAGDIEAASCNCLRAFWDCHIPEDARRVEIDMEGVDGIDGPSIAHLVGIVRAHLAAGAAVTIRRAPQMLAHTLYKVGLLENAQLQLVKPRADEQHYT